MARQNSKRRRSRGTGSEYAGEALVQTSSRLLETPHETLDFLRRSKITGYQVVPAGSNYTFFVVMAPDGGEPFLAVYKPREGENPLWDYPDGTLYRREHAAYVMSRELGWPNIPPTVIRNDGPYGAGMAQLYVPPDPEQDFFAFRSKYADDLRRIALFDILVNNGDRKAGHCLMGSGGKLWAIDHGLTFNHATRLRTVLWDFCGEPIPADLLSTVRKMIVEPEAGLLKEKLRRDLSEPDIEGFVQRSERIVRTGRFPQLDPNRNVPWPLY